MAVEQADVLVIGSGAAGAAVTKRLADLGVPPAGIVCLEQGDWVKPGDYPSARPDWEIQIHRGAFNFSPNIRRRPEDYPVGAGGHPPNVLMFNAVGGSTIHWATHFPRLHPSDFRVKSLDGVADDWPVTYKDLELYYDMNDREIGVSGISGDPANPPRSPRPTPPLPLGVLGETIGHGFDRLGWHWWVSDNAIISEAYDGRPACELHGKCMYGCPIGSKASTDVTYWPKALKKGAVLKTWARVRENHRGRPGPGAWRPLLRPPGPAPRAARARGRRLLQRHWHAAPLAQLQVKTLSSRPGQHFRHGREEFHASSLPIHRRRLRGAHRQPLGAVRHCGLQPAVL
jgi:choline dehydrogenase-like flavoprotein